MNWDELIVWSFNNTVVIVSVTQCTTTEWLWTGKEVEGIGHSQV